MKQFEDLPVWQAGRVLVREVYAVTAKVRDPGFCDQIQRAAVSVTSNIAEGHERGTTADLIQYLFYAKGSAGEVRSQLYNAEDLGYAAPAKAEALREACREIGCQLSNWIQSMQTPGFKGGPKFHKEPDRSWEKFAEKAGLERQPDGRYLKVREDRPEYGKTEDRKTENGKTEETENGKTEERKTKAGSRKRGNGKG